MPPSLQDGNTAGSNPALPTKRIIWDYCQSGQTARLGSERSQVRILHPRPKFKLTVNAIDAILSSVLRINWGYSSAVEQWTFNPLVVGSIPTAPTKITIWR